MPENFQHWANFRQVYFSTESGECGSYAPLNALWPVNRIRAAWPTGQHQDGVPVVPPAARMRQPIARAFVMLATQP